MRPATENLQNKEYEESRTDRIPTDDDDNNASADIESESWDVSTIIRYSSECATLLGVLSYVIFQQGDEIKNQGLSAFLKQLVKKIPFHFAEFYHLKSIRFDRPMHQRKPFSWYRIL